MISKILGRVLQRTKDWFIFFQRSSQLQLQSQIREEVQLIEEHLAVLCLEISAPHSLGGPLATHGRRYFSQSDEDGITLEILRRIGMGSGVCVEIGCGDGLENNTLLLLASGWRAVWIDGKPLKFDRDCNTQRLVHHQVFVTRENVVEIVESGLRTLDSESFDLLSIDVDGNDGYLAETLLGEKYRPSLIIIETNNVVPPPIRFQQTYVPDHVWSGELTDYGLSLQSAADLLGRFGYRCVACNRQTGVNAFFIHESQAAAFQDIPLNLDELYVGPSMRPFSHRFRKARPTAALVESILRNSTS